MGGTARRGIHLCDRCAAAALQHGTGARWSRPLSSHGRPSAAAARGRRVVHVGRWPPPPRLRRGGSCSRTATGRRRGCAARRPSSVGRSAPAAAARRGGPTRVRGGAPPRFAEALAAQAAGAHGRRGQALRTSSPPSALPRRDSSHRPSGWISRKRSRRSARPHAQPGGGPRAQPGARRGAGRARRPRRARDFDSPHCQVSKKTRCDRPGRSDHPTAGARQRSAGSWADEPVTSVTV